MKLLKTKARLLLAVMASAKPKFFKGLRASEKADLERFVYSFFSVTPLEELKENAPEKMFGAAYSTWKLAANRIPGVPLVRVYNPDIRKDGWKTSHTVIQIVNDDMPFLVDSITGYLSKTRGFRIHVMDHPVLGVERDSKGVRLKTVEKTDARAKIFKGAQSESYIYVEIDAQTDDKILKEIEKNILRVLEDIRNAVEDWKPMLAQVDSAVADIEKHSWGKNKHLFDEAKAFISWLKDDNFTFLGYREYTFDEETPATNIEQDQASGLGILRDPNRHVMRGAHGLTLVAAEIAEFLQNERPLLITKTNTRTTVHRPANMDYISVKKYDDKGRAVGEREFVGLFTSKSYLESPWDVPILRKKVANVQKRAPHSATGHAGKAITHILETYPRDELFLTSERQLLKTTLGVLHLMEQPRPRAFVREDRHERYVSAIVYVPRESYHSGLRQKIEKILCDAYRGEVSIYYALLGEDVLARWHFIIRTTPGNVPRVDHGELNRKIEEAAKPWAEGLREELVAAFGEAKGLALFAEYQGIFSAGYMEAFNPRQAITDIIHFEGFDISQDVSFEVFREEDDPPHSFRLNIYHPSRLIALSECLPMLENLGVRVIGENSYELLTETKGHIHAFYLETPGQDHVNVKTTEVLVEPLLDLVWKGEVENDGFNALAIHGGLPCRDIVILRAYAKYLRQLGLPFSQDLIEGCLIQAPQIARRLVRLFYVLFEPTKGTKADRRKRANGIVREIHSKLNRIQSLDQDRIFRSYLNVILATLRTNFFTNDVLATSIPKTILEAEVPVPGLAIKIRSSILEDAPKPRPYVEIFVYSPRLEGAHLRGGPVARGGIRWSDRRDDFRTEVLGLMKAQQVKNAVIVPVGAKGGFFPKQMPLKGTRDEIFAEALSCYRIFVRSLLSLTDNYSGKRIASPAKVVRWDDPDPYLVVAADKGTATFSDDANDIATSLGFWLDDAFASGGSNGYDHKKMGITAKGAAVSISRHFREMGINASLDPITVIGIGDMSGDVFGNGMLLSRQLRLLAAFDHRDIFFDPKPNAERSFKERKRLFKKPRSSWADYNPKLISPGGGVYSRSSKYIKLNKALRDFLGVDAKELTPNEIIHHMLKAEADLLWIGGIGTYVKSAKETNLMVGDRANDGVRINADELNVKVVGEGANLGVTQRARIDFARRGGRINTDFIDNSAGVDCSDKEVNIKILLASAIAHGSLAAKDRNALLASMNKDVQGIVLQDNYLQTQTISIAEAQAAMKREQHAGLIRLLEKEKRLERALENLPTDEQFSKLALKGRGLTRPDLSVLVAHSKLRLKDILLEGRILENRLLHNELVWGFPKRLRQRFEKELQGHQLRREIIATTLSNEIVNRAGVTFITEIEEETGLSTGQIVSAFLVARDTYSLKPIWVAIDALDYKVPAEIQTEMHIQIQAFLRRQVIWFLKHLKRPIKINAGIARYGDGVSRLMKNPERVLGPLEQQDFRDRWHYLVEQGVPPALAKKIAAFGVMSQACDIVYLAKTLMRTVDDAAKAYFEIGRALGFDWLRRTTEGLAEADHWDYLAEQSIIDDFADQQRELTHSILSRHKSKTGPKAVEAWVTAHQITINRSGRLLNDLKTTGTITVSKLSFAARHIRSILPRKVS